MLSLGRNAILFQSRKFVQNKPCDGTERYKATDAALYREILKVGRPCPQMNTNSKDNCNITVVALCLDCYLNSLLCEVALIIKSHFKFPVGSLVALITVSPQRILNLLWSQC